MGNKQPVSTTKLNFPIYGSCVIDRFLILGGGGGYEVKNQLSVYDLQAT